MARIDYTTQTQDIAQNEYFSDFLASFDKSPMSSDLAIIRNENSIKQSVRNLILTNLGERLFRPTIGGNVNRMMFEPMTGFTADDLKKDILNTIRQNEPRVSSSDLIVTVIPSYDQNQITVNILFTIVTSPNQITLSIILQRVR
jgi:phage baseplate assembly protein W